MKAGNSTSTRLTISLALALVMASCSAQESASAASDSSGPDCFTNLNAFSLIRDFSRREGLLRIGPRLIDEPECSMWHKRAIIFSRESLLVDDTERAQTALDAFSSSVAEVESERLFYLYAIAKFRGDRHEMMRIASRLRSQNPSSPYTSLVEGIELCARDECARAVSFLEAANEALEMPLARGYLAVAYAYAGDSARAEKAIDDVASDIGAQDQLVFYVGVATYVETGRVADARDMADRYFAENPDQGDSPMLREVRRLLKDQ